MAVFLTVFLRNILCFGNAPTPYPNVSLVTQCETEPIQTFVVNYFFQTDGHT